MVSKEFLLKAYKAQINRVVEANALRKRLLFLDEEILCADKELHQLQLSCKTKLDLEDEYDLFWNH